jgi:hypothetical protein
MNQPVNSAYTTNAVGKIASLAAALGSAYVMMRSGTNVTYLGSARQAVIDRENNVDSYIVNTGQYDPEAPVLSQMADWWRLRGVDVQNGTDSFMAACQSVFFWLGDSWVPLTTLIASLSFGFRKELGTMAKTISKYLPDTNWGHVIEQGLTGTAKLAGHTIGGTWSIIRGGALAAWGLGQKSPVGAAVLGLLALMTGSKFISVLKGDNQQMTLRDDLTKFYR